MGEIKAIKPQPNSELIEELTQLLEQAKTGEVQAAAIVTLNAQAEFAMYWDRGTNSILSLLGGAEMLKADITMNGMEW